MPAMKWRLTVTDCQEIPLRVEEFETEAEALARYAEINAKAEEEFAAGRFAEEITTKPQRWAFRD